MYLTPNKKVIHIHLLILEKNYQGSERERNEENVVVPKRRKLEILSQKPQYHFVWIKNLSRLVSGQVSAHHGRIFICDCCFAYFHNQDKLKRHEKHCRKINKCVVTLPSPNPKLEVDNSYNIMKFKNYNNKQEVPFVIYADFESVLKKIDNDHRKMHEHLPCAVGYYFICSYDDTKSYYRDHVGEDSPAWFVQELRNLAEEVDEILKNPKPMDPLTDEEEHAFQTALFCHICELPFAEGEERVRDHSHLTGKFRSAAHMGCNLNFKDWRTIPVIFHNLTGYDSHYLINDLANSFDGKITLIPINKEKYISFTKHK